MNKILIIDDKKEQGSMPQNIVGLASTICVDDPHFKDIVICSKKASDYFSWEPAGNECIPLFDSKEYDFIFIHHSLQGDSIFPSNIVDLIKNVLGTKLILFSGSSSENFLNTSETYTYRSISRPKLLSKLEEFIKKSFIINEWKAEILFFEYEERLIKEIIILQDNISDEENIHDTYQFITLLKLKHVTPGTSKYSLLHGFKDDKLIEELRKL